MKRWIQDLDRVLRGQATTLPALREGRIDVHVGGLVAVLTVLGMIAGFCMGWFALFNRPGEPAQWMQLLASSVKVPLLFLLTLIVTFPSLYVFNALMGSRLHIAAVARLLLVAIAVTLAVLASFGPIIAFFSVTSTSYSFILLLNVLVFAVAGVLGLTFLLQTLHRLTIVMGLEAPPPPPKLTTALSPPTPAPGPSAQPQSAPAGPVTPAPASVPAALDRLEGHVLGRHVRAVFHVWVVVFAVVGAQMSWVLRPFVGDPQLPFAWFRPRESNFFEAVWKTFLGLFS